jgi:hypothetical protein
MTFDRKIVVGIEDIESISLECNKCKVRLTFSPDEIKQIPSNCPNPSCNVEWLPPLSYGSHEPKVPVQMKLVHSIVGVRHRLKENKVEKPNDVAGYRILLEFKEPKPSA